MMGQQETTMVATEEKGGERLMKRIVVLLTVVALMVVMSVAPAFAVGALKCYNSSGGSITVLANDRDLAVALGFTKCRGLVAPVPR